MNDKDGILLGVGLDNEDGHKRVTTAENILIAGGSEETHERMTETALKTVEELRSRGKSLATVGKDELIDIIGKNSSR